MTHAGLHDALCGLLPAQLATVISKLGVPEQYLPGTQTPIAIQASEILRWVEQQGRMSDLQQIVAEVMRPRDSITAAFMTDQVYSTPLPSALVRAVALFKTGDKQCRMEADRLLESEAATFDYEWLIGLDSRAHDKYERAMMAKALGHHPQRDVRGLATLLNMLATAPAEGGVYSYRILTSVRKMLLEGVGGKDPMENCSHPKRCLAALDLLASGKGPDSSAAATHVKTLLIAAHHS